MWANRGKKRSNFPAIKTVTSPNGGGGGGGARLSLSFEIRDKRQQQTVLLILNQIQITF